MDFFLFHVQTADIRQITDNVFCQRVAVRKRGNALISYKGIPSRFLCHSAERAWGLDRSLRTRPLGVRQIEPHWRPLLIKALVVPAAVPGNSEPRADIGRHCRVDELTDAADDALECLRFYGVGNRGRGQGRIQSEKISSKPGNVWGGHGSPREKGGSPIIPSRNNVGP